MFDLGVDKLIFSDLIFVEGKMIYVEYIHVKVSSSINLSVKNQF